MDLPTDGSNTCDQSLSIECIKLREVCGRLLAWAAVPAPQDSPLIELAKSQVQATASEAQGLLRNIVVYQSNNDQQPVLAALKRAWLAISNAYGVLELCTEPTVERAGTDGAINTAYATMYLTGHPNEVLIQDTPYDRVKAIHLARSSQKMFSAWFGPEASNCWWGLPGMPLPALDPAELLRSRVTDLADQYRRAFSSRYVHRYAAHADVPYTVDNSTAEAHGSFGVVRKVHNRNTGEYYAAKSLQVLSGRDRKKILREIGCLELCVQENLIALVEAYEVEADPYSLVIVMKPWASYSLWNFLSNPDASRRAVLPWFKPSHANSNQQVYRIMSGIVAAVQFLHQRSIKHKDIKPQNILLHLEDGRVRPIVTDVGESKVYRHGGSTDPMKSSYEYLAPEQQLATDEVQSTLKADIWQLGCCFAMLLVVARRGTAGLYQLWHSFHNTDENCSCNIANQSGPFLSKLEEICTPSSALEEHAYQIVLQMLERDPHARLDIMAVRQTLDFLLV